MKFNKGAELDKQIYKEGESTWGCKYGVLDVEDVKDFIEVVEELVTEGCMGTSANCYNIKKVIREKAGLTLCKSNNELGGKNEKKIFSKRIYCEKGFA